MEPGLVDKQECIECMTVVGEVGEDGLDAFKWETL